MQESLVDPEALERELSPAARKMRMLRTLVCGNRYERAARATGAKVVAGVDEVGRGALFGPVVAAAVILPEGCRIPGLRDSKQLIAEERERLARIVERKPWPWRSRKSMRRPSTASTFTRRHAWP
jgi:ribonuclease HII